MERKKVFVKGDSLGGSCCGAVQVRDNGRLD